MGTASAVISMAVAGALMTTAYAQATDDVAFTARADGSVQRYVRVLPDGFEPDEYHDVLIALHGHWSDRWQGVSDRAEFKASMDVAMARNMVYVSPDYRATTSWMGLLADQDMVQIIDELRAQYRIARVFISGASMGGASCLAFTAMHPEMIAGVASMNGMADMVEYDTFLAAHLSDNVCADIYAAIHRSYGGTPLEVPAEYGKRSAGLHPELFTMPVGIAAGGADGLVPAASVERLADTLTKRGTAVLNLYLPNGGHQTSYEDAAAIVEYVIANAAPFGPTATRPTDGTKRLTGAAPTVRIGFGMDWRPGSRDHSPSPVVFDITGRTCEGAGAPGTALWRPRVSTCYH